MDFWFLHNRRFTKCTEMRQSLLVSSSEQASLSLNWSEIPKSGFLVTRLIYTSFQINDIVAEFEQEKFEMQKQHTKSIQEILDDTNARLQKMEKEYSQQTLSTVSSLYTQQT